MVMDASGVGMGVQSLDDLLPMDTDLKSLEVTVPPPTQLQSSSGLTPQPSSFNNLTPLPSDTSSLFGGFSGVNMSGAGAGPLPTGFGMPPPQGSSSSLTEFTKRRNWSQRVIEEMKDFLHILTADGRIMWCSPSVKTLTGYEPSQLYGLFMFELVHPDDSGLFIREFNESIATGHVLRFFYRFKKFDDSWTIFECHGHPHLTSEPQAHGYCAGVFMMSRPYPTKNASLLDSFLEHKIENERLKKKIADLKQEEQEEQEALERQWMNKDEQGQSSITPSDTKSRSEVDGNTASSNKTPSYNAMPPPAKPTVSNIALTRQNLDEALAASKPDSISDKMARYEGATHLETIEMLTGLRYRDGERSQGISTGDMSPVLIRGDAGIAISADKDSRSREDKKKKLKVADEYVCTDCGTLDSPEWRKGPNGPKTLCNACGCKSHGSFLVPFCTHASNNISSSTLPGRALHTKTN
jgi:PAS domain S-box-containing protein